MKLTITPIDQPTTYYDAHVVGDYERRVTAEWSIALDAILARRLGAHVRSRLAAMEAAKEKK